MVNKKILIWIGIYLVVDGAVSWYYFLPSATMFQQVIRLVRIIIGAYLYFEGRK